MVTDIAALHWHTTIAPDGTSIGYLSVGDASSPGLVIVHGAMQSAVSQLELATALAPGFTVHLIDRRGRGTSGPYPNPYTTATDVSDVQAVMAATGSRNVLGISSGAVIAARLAIEAATTPAAPPVDNLVLFEPALVLDHSVSLSFADRIDAELDAGDLPNALVTGMLGTQMGPTFLRFVPRPLLRAITSKMLTADDAKELTDGVVHIRVLAEMLRYDLAIVAENAERSEEFTPIQANVLLLNGDRTRPYLAHACAALATILPGATRVVLPGLGHSATQNRAERGKPAVVAAAVVAFLRASPASTAAGARRPPAVDDPEG